MVFVNLTARYRCVRRKWTTKHVKWGRNEWRNIHSSDESRFSVYPDNLCNLVWREHGTKNYPVSLQGRVRIGDRGVVVYAGISGYRRTDLHIIRNGHLVSQRYRYDILRPIVVPYVAAVGDDIIIMDDYCKKHRTLLVDDLFSRKESYQWNGQRII